MLRREFGKILCHTAAIINGPSAPNLSWLSCKQPIHIKWMFNYLYCIHTNMIAWCSRFLDPAWLGCCHGGFSWELGQNLHYCQLTLSTQSEFAVLQTAHPCHMDFQLSFSASIQIWLHGVEGSQAVIGLVRQWDMLRVGVYIALILQNSNLPSASNLSWLSCKQPIHIKWTFVYFV